MTIRDLDGKNVCILGYGKEGQAMAAALKEYAPKAVISVADGNADAKRLEFPSEFGPDYLSFAAKADVIVKSPGVKPTEQIEGWRREGKLTSGTQLFLQEAENAHAVVIGVTGSKGKSTTSTLIYEMLKTLEKEVHLVGNIGEPAIAHLGEIKQGTMFVMELSSYQLLDVSVSPTIAVITSFFPEHLDYHGSLESYREAKTNIVRFQNDRSTVFYAKNSEASEQIANVSPGIRIPFSPEECPVPLEETHLLGEHNRSNIAGAYKVCLQLGVDSVKATEVIRNFRGLPHRLQSLGTHHGYEWIDDAISTTPESTIAALDALGDRVHTIILGGQDRGLDFHSLAERIRKSNIKVVLLLPGSGSRIREALEQSGAKVNFSEVTTMEEVVHITRNSQLVTPTKKGQPPPICLLSTASPSYNLFKNFEEKGEKFKEAILARKPKK